MGEQDGPSGAAHSAQSMVDQNTSAELSFFVRLMIKLGVANSATEENYPDSIANDGEHSIMNLRKMRVEDVAVPTAEIISVPDTISKEALVEIFRESGLTRIPVYSVTLDTPIGMAHLKDFALRYGFRDMNGDFDLIPMLRPLLYVPQSMTIGVLLTKMQAERRHMALVVDEYGGVDGLVTIEDLIEQVVGEIEDEHDLEDDTFWILEDSGKYLVKARTPLKEFCAEAKLNLTDGEDIDGEEIETLGGLVFMLAGRVPVRGEVIEHPAGVEFEIIDADARRVKRMRVQLPRLKQAAE
jgi:magnesium and cobalt transporter